MYALAFSLVVSVCRRPSFPPGPDPAAAGTMIIIIIIIIIIIAMAS